MSTPVPISVDKAVSIINEMRARKVINYPMPETDEEKIAKAQEIVEFARKAHEDGNTNPAIAIVMNILSLPDTDPAIAGGAEGAVEAPETPAEPENDPEPQNEVEEIQRDIKERVSGFPVPILIQDPGPFPADLTALSMAEIRKLAGTWNRVFASAQWNLSLEQSSLLRAEQVHEHKRGQALKKVDRKDEDGKNRLAAAIEADIASDPEVREWKDRVVKHEAFVTMFKGLVSIYNGNIERLSREITARMAEDGANRHSERKP